MKLSVTIILSLTLFLSNINQVNGQINRLYIDNVKRYMSITDSLISSFYDNPATQIIHSSAHYNCINQVYGAFLDFHEDTTGTYSRLDYSSVCDTPMVEKTYYLFNNKIVFAATKYPQGQKKTITKFYMDDRLLLLNSNLVKKDRKKFDNDLKEGYAKLKSLKTQ